MLERVSVDLTGGQEWLTGAVFRYEVIARLSRCSRDRGVTLLAFGFGGAELRVVLEGPTEAVPNVLRGLKVGTVRAAARWGISFTSGVHVRTPVDDLVEAVAWAHHAPVECGASGPLDSPWSSHRDLLGLRRAEFFDARPLLARVDPEAVHARCGGAPLAAGWRARPGGREDLGFLLRVAGGVLGMLPADRRCFRLFVHLGRARGWRTGELAQALALTPRRVRQLASEAEPTLSLATAALADTRLSKVP